MNRPVNHVLSRQSQTQSQTPRVFSYVEREEEILPEQEGGKGGQWKTCDMRAERTLQREDGPAGGAGQGSEGRRHLQQSVIDTCLKIMEPMTLYTNLKLILKETYVNEIICQNTLISICKKGPVQTWFITAYGDMSPSVHKILEKANCGEIQSVFAVGQGRKMTTERHLKGMAFQCCVNYTTVILIPKNKGAQAFAPKSLCQIAAKVFLPLPNGCQCVNIVHSFSLGFVSKPTQNIPRKKSLKEVAVSGTLGD